MFRSDFAEGVCPDRVSTDLGDGLSDVFTSDEAPNTSQEHPDEDDHHSYTFEDSDDEEDGEDASTHIMHLRLPTCPQQARDDENAGGDTRPSSWASIAGGDAAPADPDEQESRNVRQKISHPSSPRSERADVALESPVGPPTHVKAEAQKEPVLGPPKLQVVVKDAAYATYRAVLFYVSIAPQFDARAPLTRTCRFTRIRSSSHRWRRLSSVSKLLLPQAATIQH